MKALINNKDNTVTIDGVQQTVSTIGLPDSIAMIEFDTEKGIGVLLWKEALPSIEINEITFTKLCSHACAEHKNALNNSELKRADEYRAMIEKAAAINAEEQKRLLNTILSTTKKETAGLTERIEKLETQRREPL